MFLLAVELFVRDLDISAKVLLFLKSIFRDYCYKNFPHDTRQSVVLKHFFVSNFSQEESISIISATNFLSIFLECVNKHTKLTFRL